MNRPKKISAAPNNFLITDRMRQWATKKVPELVNDLSFHTECFLDHHLARDNKFADWEAAWRNWMRIQVRIESDRYWPAWKVSKMRLAIQTVRQALVGMSDDYDKALIRGTRLRCKDFDIEWDTNLYLRALKSL